MTSITGLYLGKVLSNWVNVVVKIISIQGPLAGFRRDANPPYFGKRGDFNAYFPKELKRDDFQTFSDIGFVIRAYFVLIIVHLPEQENYPYPGFV